MKQALENLEVKVLLTDFETTMDLEDKTKVDHWLNHNGYLLLRVK